MYQEVRLAMQRMPFLLRWITAICLAFSLFLPAALVPFGEHWMDGKEVSFTEFWRQGGGPLFAGSGMLAIALSYGFIRATRWARSLAVVAGIGLVILHFLEETGNIWEMMMTTMLLVVVWPGYLFLSQSVRHYFVG